MVRGAGSAPRTAAIVPAAGRGERLGSGEAKALRRLGNDSLLERAVRNLAAAHGIDLVIAAVPADAVSQVAERLTVEVPVLVVAGGETRQRTVANGLAALPDSVEFVLVHDAARALTPSSLHEAVLGELRESGADAVVPVVPVPDTIKTVRDDVVVRTLPRDDLRAVQTPQGFTRRALERAHAAAQGTGIDDATDDAGLCEAVGIEVRTIAGDPMAFKITRPMDWAIAEALVEHA